MTLPLVVDFETDAIAGNTSIRPPAPVGVSIKNPGYKSRYFAWGHPTGNNCSGPEKAQQIVAQAIADKRPLLFHNAKFDIAVMQKYWHMRPEQVEDSMFLIYLHDPYASTFSLKPSAQRILNLPPDEQDDLHRWILAHVPEATPKTAGAYICRAPGDLVAPYANGDVDRTLKLWAQLHGEVPFDAYQRELRLLPLVMEGERQGVRVDLARLGEDGEKWEAALERADGTLRKLLKAPNVNLDSGDELADALDAAGMISQWKLTPTGRRSTARKALEASIANPTVLGLLRYRGALSHCLSNFARPWYELGQEYGGRLHPDWNQVRQARGGDTYGTRTGRLSCGKPNFQNPPNAYEIEVPKGFPPLPIMRRYLLPDEGCVWLKRDYSQQELRLAAGYSEGRLYQRYKEDPRIDAHAETGALIKEFVGVELPRKHVKIVGFSLIYGSGIPALAGQLGVDMGEAARVKAAYLTALPEMRELMDECKARGRSGSHITTWGGRHYFVEPPSNGRTYEYKLLNYLIQGSAADMTKEALCRWYADRGQGRFLATVHDEVNICSPVESSTKDMRLLRKAMESLEFDVKMLSDGFRGDSWGNLEECA